MQKAICSLATLFSLVSGERVSNRQTTGVVLLCGGVAFLSGGHPVFIFIALVLMSVGYCFISKTK